MHGENASCKTIIGHDAIVEDTCKVVDIHTCTKLQNDYLEIFNGKPVIPVGLLPQEGIPMNEITAHQPYWQILADLTGLEEQRPRSVQFVGLGKECKYIKNHAYEIENRIQLSETFNSMDTCQKKGKKDWKTAS